MKGMRVTGFDGDATPAIEKKVTLTLQTAATFCGAAIPRTPPLVTAAFDFAALGGNLASADRQLVGLLRLRAGSTADRRPYVTRPTSPKSTSA